MSLIALLLFGGVTALAWRDHRKGPPPLIRWVGGKPRLSPAWWPHVAEELGDILPRAGADVHSPQYDPMVLAWVVLHGHVPPRVGGLPPNPFAPRVDPWQPTPWQTYDPNAPGYWDGNPVVLDLMVFVRRVIHAALPLWYQTGQMNLHPEDIGG